MVAILLAVIAACGCERSGPAAGAKDKGAAKPNAGAKIRLQKSKSDKKIVIGAEIERATDVAAMIARLKEHEGLREIVLQDCGRITSKDLTALAEFQSLNSVEFVLCTLDPDVARGLKQLPALQKLVLAATPLTQAHFEQLATIQGLRHFALRGRGYSYETMAGLKSLTQIRELTIDRDDLEIGKLASIETWPPLVALRFPGLTMTDADLAALPRLPDLTALEFLPGKISDAGVGHLRKFPRLKAIDLTGTTITNDGLKILTELPELRSLDIHGCRGIDDKGVPRLLRCLKLRELQIEGTKITAAGFLELARLKSLRTIKVGTRQVSSDAAEKFSKRLPNCKVIRLRPPPRLG